ncbi:MAG: hypothetical protein Ta2D_13320 [Rickettsiales bacterium]|nr:MAG: hypothetical protein Ta2D_13320 [Rickettsiales bacterium]
MQKINDSNIDNVINKAKEYYKELCSEEDTSIKNQIEKIKEEIEEYRKELFESNENEEYLSIKENIENFYNKIDDLYNKLFNDEKIETMNENGEKIVSIKTYSTKNQISNLLESFKKEKSNIIMEYNKENKDRKNEYNTIKSEIIELLPQAMATGLAFDYNLAKQDYGLKFKTDKKDNKKQVFAFWKSFLSNSFYYLLFLLPLCFLGYNITYYFKNVENITISIVFSRILFNFPFIWLVWFGNRSITLRRRLYEEYNHKEKVIRMYSGLSREFVERIGSVKNIDEEECSDIDNKIKEIYINKYKELLDIVLNTIKNNPSEILGVKDGFVDRILSKNISISKDKAELKN